jgi:Raf kinase inhibitor-like YbhB/YbcL family protein
MALTLTSASFKDGDYLSNDHVLSAAYGFGCDGGNVSPQFSWTGVPAGAQSLALTCFDPDAPTGSGFWHWVMVNIPPDTTSLELGAGNPESGTLPPGTVQVRTDFGAPGYGGPCPPEGDHPHRYIFTLSAVSLAELPNISAAVVGFYLHFNTIEKASLMGLYKR